jgi:hypothetical protein
MAYTRVNWVDNPSTSTPVDAALLNTMDAYIATLDTTAAKLASANVFTAKQEVDLALSGAAKTFLTLKATDGKQIDFIITTAGSLQIKNVTDGVVLLEVGPGAGTIYASAAATNYKVWHANNDGAGSGLDADMIGGRQIRVASADPGLGVGSAWIKDA